MSYGRRLTSSGRAEKLTSIGKDVLSKIAGTSAVETTTSTAAETIAVTTESSLLEGVAAAGMEATYLNIN